MRRIATCAALLFVLAAATEHAQARDRRDHRSGSSSRSGSSARPAPSRGTVRAPARPARPVPSSRGTVRAPARPSSASGAVRVPATPSTAGPTPARNRPGTIVRDHRGGRTVVRAPRRPYYYYHDYYYYSPYWYYSPYFGIYYGAYYPGYYGTGHAYGYRRGGYPTAVAESAPPPEQSIGLRLRAVGLRESEDGGGLGLYYRVAGERFGGEIELAGDGYDTLGRSDLRFGGTFLLYLMRHTMLEPYLLLGGGMNRARFDGIEGDTVQLYLEGGGGVAWRINPAFSLEADLRWSSRRILIDGPPYIEPYRRVPEREGAVLFGISAAFTF